MLQSNLIFGFLGGPKIGLIHVLLWSLNLLEVYGEHCQKASKWKRLIANEERDLMKNNLITVGSLPLQTSPSKKLLGQLKPNEPRREKTGFLHMRKQRRRSASR